MQAGRDGQRLQRPGEHVPIRLLLEQGAFQHRLGQLLHEQRHAIGVLDDLLRDFPGERFAGSQPVQQRRALAPVQPFERVQGHVGRPDPRRLKLRPERNHQQYRPPLHESTNLSSTSSEVGSTQCTSSKIISTGPERVIALI